jgi:transketolase
MSIFLQHAHAHMLTAARQKKGLHLIIAASHTGVAVGPDGGSAHDVSDIARMRLIPEFTVISPWDPAHVRKILDVVMEIPGYYYIRLNRPKVPVFLKDPVSFEIGKAYRLKCGSQISIVASGDKVWTALQVAEELGEGVADVIGVATFEPFDRATIVESAARTGRVVTIEDHLAQGGLFEAVAGVLAEEHPTRMRKLSVPRQFTTSGEPDELARRYELDHIALIETCRRFIG